MPTKKSTTQPKARVVSNASDSSSRTTSAVGRTPTASSRLQATNMQMDPKMRKNLLIALIIGLILAGLYYARGWFVVAIVNGQPVTRYEVIQELERQAGQGTVDQIVSKKLVRMEAEKKGIAIPQKDIDAHLKKIEDDLKTSGQSLDELLKAQGLTRADVEEQTELQLMLKKLLEDKVAVTDEEVEAAFEQQSAAMPEGMTEEEFKKELRSSLEEQKFAFEAQTYIQELQSKASITKWHEY